MWRGTGVGFAIAFSLLLAMACSGDDDADRVCSQDEDCVLVDQCCRCEALNASTQLPACNVTCDTTQCFEQHGQVQLSPVCVAGLCEVQQSE